MPGGPFLGLGAIARSPIASRDAPLGAARLDRWC